ncbi:MAG TPA: helix-turn-helix domain-containing protein [Gammaproteobacteria bacterium]|nr:helix-turn-helix domain-containing protein [Gammaproteobacteria bacterium]
MTLETKVVALRRHVMQRVAAGIPVSRVCREAGISRTLFYAWKRRYLRYGDAGLHPRPSRPARWGRQSSPALEHAVLAYALQWPTHGPQQISDQLRRAVYGARVVSPTGVYKILRRHGLRTRWERLARLEGAALQTLGLVTERSARQLAKTRHVEAERPGELVCLDSFYIGHLKGVGKLWQLTACDAASSYGVAQVIRGHPTNAAAARFLLERVLPVYRRAGHRVRAVLTDGGPEWRVAFDAACRGVGVEHRRTQAHHAWTNGFVERLQGTILSEHWRVVFRRTYFTRLGQLEQTLQRYLRFYNTERTHRGYRLQGRTPASVFFTKASR